MKIKVEMNLCDALNYLSFLEASIQVMTENSNTPDGVLLTSEVIGLQNCINDAIMKQANYEDISKAIEINNNNT